MNALVCQSCDREHSLNDPIWRCTCGGILDIRFLARFGEGAERYRHAIPIERDENIVTYGQGYTPVMRVPLGEGAAWVKLDSLLPTGSFKDRGAAVLVSKARELGISRVVEDSSGNAGAALAGHCALAGIAADIYVPEQSVPGKLAQIRAYGATVHMVPGTREDLTRAAIVAAEQSYYASHAWNPFFLQGTKTCAYEIADQFAGNLPHTVIVPVGNATLLLGLHIGFGDLLAAGRIDAIPKLIGVQSEICSPLATACQQGLDAPTAAASTDTVADGIRVTHPIRGRQILHTVRETNGTILAVSEDAIRRAHIDLGRRGIYVEPTSAVAWAAAAQYMTDGGSGETIVVVMTGNGLKTPATL